MNDERELKEYNILAATWINDFGKLQKEMEQKQMFFSNETMLEQQNLRNHFNRKNIKKFYQHY